MSRIPWLPVLGLVGWLALAPSACGQARPYIGYVYPAGGQQGTTFQIKLGGQSMDDVTDVMVTGKGVSARVVDCYRRVGPQEIQLLSEQLRELRGAKRAVASAAASTKVSPAPERTRPRSS